MVWLKRVAHVQRAGHVGGRQLNAEIVALCGSLGVWRTCAAKTGHTVTAFFPFRPPMRLQGGGLKRFGQAVEARLLQCFSHGNGSVNDERHPTVPL
jgi:hypothetical protein